MRNAYTENKLRILTRTLPCFKSHSMSSLPPPELNKRRSEHEGTPSGTMSSGSRKAKDKVSTFEGKGPANVYRLVTTHG